MLTTPKSLTDIGIEDLSTLLPHGVHGTPSEARLLLPISTFVVAAAYPSSALHLLFLRWNVFSVEHFGLLLASSCSTHIGGSTERPNDVSDIPMGQYDQFLYLGNCVDDGDDKAMSRRVYNQVGSRQGTPLPIKQEHRKVFHLSLHLLNYTSSRINISPTTTDFPARHNVHDGNVTFLETFDSRVRLPIISTLNPRRILHGYRRHSRH